MSDLIIRNVVKALKQSKFLGIKSIDGVNLVTDTQVLLKLDDDEFWEIQASFRLREFGFYQKGRPYVNCRDFPQSACGMVKAINDSETVFLKSTHLYDISSDYTSLCLARDDNYVFVQKKYMDMFDIVTLQQAKNNELAPVLINGVHVVMPIKKGNVEYLKPLQAS